MTENNIKSKRSIYALNRDLKTAAEKNPIIAQAISAGADYTATDISRINNKGRLVVEPGIMFNGSGDAFRYRNSKFLHGACIVAVSDNMSAKMLNVCSVSTSTLDNDYCRVRAQNPKSICFACFAENTLDMYSDLAKNCSSNTALLKNVILPPELIPHFITDIVRFESFGDLNNVIHFINYINFAKANPNVWFTLWTKNAFIVRLVIRMGVKIPKNLHLIKSSQFVNKQCDRTENDIFDAVFTVYDADYLDAHGYNESNFINCGGRSCRTCMNCYGRKINKRIINEKKK